MPITAKLSRKFYDTLGDEVANELVNWLNAVDDSYRAEFRHLFDANFGRLEAEMRALEARFDAKLSALESRIEARFDRFETRILRWMLVFWAGTMGTVIALLRL